jgi:hypothetical protein
MASLRLRGFAWKIRWHCRASPSFTPQDRDIAAFADAMSTSYGALIELFSVDPASGAETELADTSITNLLAELPVLETQANGANLGLQLADGTQVRFASTARTGTFLYSLAVQQMQATSFVTDNYNLDMQWLNTVDQPLLDEAAYWRHRPAGQRRQRHRQQRGDQHRRQRPERKRHRHRRHHCRGRQHRVQRLRRVRCYPHDRRERLCGPAERQWRRRL